MGKAETRLSNAPAGVGIDDDADDDMAHAVDDAVDDGDDVGVTRSATLFTSMRCFSADSHGTLAATVATVVTKECVDVDGHVPSASP